MVTFNGNTIRNNAVGNRTKQVCGSQTTTYVYSVNDQLLEEKLTDTSNSVNNRLTNRTYNASRMTQEICYRSHTVATANRLLQKDHAYAYDGRLTTTLYHWNMSGVFQLREYVRSFCDTLGLTVFTDHYENTVNDGNYTVKYRTRYLYDLHNPTGYAQAMRETFNDTITGSDVLLRTHSHTFGHERVSEKTTIAAQPNAPQTYFFVHDGLSNTRCLTDTAGAAVQRYDYDAYGNAIGFNPVNALTQYLYCGELFDHKLGWTYLRARYYDPKVGRFNRLDPFFGNVSDPQSLHKYTYCHGDPVNGVDPSGMFFGTMGFLGAALIGSTYRAIFHSKDVTAFGAVVASLSTKTTIGVGLTCIALDAFALIYRYASPFVLKEYTIMQINAKREQYILNVQNKVSNMFLKQSPIVSGQTLPLTEKNTLVIGRIIGEAYTEMVVKFLENHYFPTASQGERFPWETEKSNPWCADWSAATCRALNELHLKSIVIHGGKPISIGSILWVDQGQMNPDDSQHNFCVIYPMGYKSANPSHDPIVLIFDPWQRLLPEAFTIDEYPYPVHRIGNIVTRPGE